MTLMPASPFSAPGATRLDPAKFKDPDQTAKGEPRARIRLSGLHTVWFNTGTLCNLACGTCYIESSPTNDALVYLSLAEVRVFLDEIATGNLPVREIGFTGGEPFMNRDLPAMLDAVLARGFEALVLTNAMRPMVRHKDALQALRARHGDKLTLRVSLDHHSAALHEAERGPGTWAPALDGLRWLSDQGFAIAVAGRQTAFESATEAREGYRALFATQGVAIDAGNPQALVLFPDMDASADVPEITTACWDILHKDPASVMCASSRMVVKRKGEAVPSVVACTLLPYDPQFDLGPTLSGARDEVALNHPHCAKFCVLGGASCSA